MEGILHGSFSMLVRIVRIESPSRGTTLGLINQVRIRLHSSAKLYENIDKC